MNQNALADTQSCPFCRIDRLLVAQSDLAIAFEDKHPASPGHVLIAPRRHVASYFGCTTQEKTALWDLVERVREFVESARRPDGFNVGFNAGLAAGQTVFHAHIHVIPRYANDVADPSGGIRHAVIGRGYYKHDSSPSRSDEGLNK